MRKIFQAFCWIIFVQSVALGQQPVFDGLNTMQGFPSDRLGIISDKGKGFPKNTELALAIIEGDQVYYYGCRRENDSLVTRENRDAVFEIGSISKVFTSILMSHAINDGKIELHQPIQDVIDFKFAFEDSITFWHLSNHTAGLPSIPSNMFPMMAKMPDNPYKDYDGQALERYLKEDIKTNAPIGEKSQYSNLGVGLLGYLLTKISEQPYESLLQERIFEPLKMGSSTTRKSLVATKLVKGQNRHGKPTSSWDFDALAGAGAICSSVEDLVKFAKFSFMQNPINDLIQTKTIGINHEMGVALGWHTYRLRDLTWFWHNGGTGGYRSCMAVDPQNKRAIIILSNVSTFHSESDQIDSICFELARSMK